MILATIIFSVFAVPQFDLQTLGGETSSGAIVVLAEDKLVVAGPSGNQSFAIVNLLDVTAKKPAAIPPRPTILVELVDGSRIPVRSFRVTAGSAELDLGNQSVQLPVKVLRWVRFLAAGEPTGSIESSWNEIVLRQPVSDLLVIRKTDAIDSTDGVVGNITDETIAFTLDGDQIPVKRPKVEGIIFAKTAVDEFPEPKCAIRSANGSRFRASEVQIEGDVVRLITASGLKATLPLADVVQFDFSDGKIAYLSDLDPESFSYQPYFAPDNPVTSLNAFYQLRRDTGPEHGPLRLDGQTYRKGVSLYSRSVVSYRLPGKFRLFKAKIGIDDAVRTGSGNVAIEVNGDGKSLWKGTVRGGEAATALELDITGVRRLEIVAGFGEGQDVADHVDLCDAKVTK